MKLENYQFWVRTVKLLVISLAPALLVLWIGRRVLRPLTRLTLPSRLWPAVRRLWQALLEITARVMPMVGFFIVAGVLVGLLEASPVVQETVRFLLCVILVYEVVAQSIRVALDPDQRTATRLFPLSHETAKDLWVWTRRLLMYGGLYAVIMHILHRVYEDPQTYQGVRGLLLAVFPALVTGFVVQVARRRARPAAGVSPDTGVRVFQTTWRVIHTLWPFLMVIYAWSLTLLIISHHTGGVSYLVWGSVKTVLVACGLFWVLRWFNRLFDYVLRIGDELRHRYPLLEAKANRYLKTLREVCNGLLVLLAVGLVFEIWGVPVSGFLTSPLGAQVLARTLIIALAVGLTSVAMGMSKTIADVLLQTRIDARGVVHEPTRKRKTLVPLAHAVIRVAIIFVAVLIILEQLNINTAPILAGVGILGLAISFGAQSLVKDVINGLFILFEDSVSVGDVAILRGTGGLVEKVTLRAVTLRDLSGNVHVIPNGSIDMVTNMTKEYSRYVLDVGVAYRENVDEVIGILKDVDEEMRADPAFSADMLEPIEILGLDRFADSAIIIRARLKTKPIRQWYVGREFNRRMKKAFDERGIEIPFPHRTLYWGLPKQGSQDPIHVAVEEASKVYQKD
jgi:small conductance mechanosensitive channel